ncbi:MAG TPA: nucleotide disphospho-sugar-binding domain-containing protein [Opitutales bacterium]|jgi:rhamnosyltransferase subunit B|nr:nucleotide disphospho-sugar-binding domain-containing protein [Opitutales bacterium]
MRPLSILLAPFGSEGDVRPTLWLASGLAARGHRVTFIITPYYRHLVAARGWRVVDIGTQEEFTQTMRDPRLWQPRRGSELVIDLMLESLPRYNQELDGLGEKFDLVIGTTLATGAFTWAEKKRIPRLMLQLQPMCLRGADDCPLFLENWEWLCHAPRFVKRALFALFDFAVARQVLRPANAYRAQVGLPALRRVYEEFWNGADGVAALFPDWYAAPQAEWPQNVRQFGFPLELTVNQSRDLPLSAPQSLAPEVGDFLAAGSPPILWTHGSANIHTEAFATGAHAATELLGARGILVGPAARDFPPSGNFLSARSMPFSQIFPRCRAVVHHGGIGTSAQALAEGVPQLIVPLAHDQPDNARRLERLGVAAHLNYHDFSGAGAAAKLRALLDNPATPGHCVRLQQKISSENFLPALCDWAEQLAGNAC